MKWGDERQAETILRDIAAHPLAPITGGGHAHQH
jgi:hypothetical protein